MTNSVKQKNAPEVFQCSKCGACLVTCPIYRELEDEVSSPRAKVQLIRHYAEKDLPTSAYLNTLVNRCLMCGNCTAICPSGVKHDSLFMRMRSYMAVDHGEGWHLKVLYHFLSHEQQLRLASRFAKLGRNHMLEHLAREVRVGNIPVKRLPQFNQRPFREQMAEVVEPAEKQVGTVLYFTGCGTNYVYGKTGRNLCRILTTMGFRVEIPKAQVCCGLPIFAHGNLEKARRNIQTNISLFNRSDIVAVVTDCATCGSALCKEYPIVLKELGLDDHAAIELGSKVRDVSEFIQEHYELLEPHLDQNAAKQKVTYHMPCHLRNGMGIKSEVETLLKRLPNVEYVRAADHDRCCGGGGSFFYDYPDTSYLLVRKKIDNAKATGAELWVTGCPGCSLNLSGNLSESDNISVEHVLQLIERTLKDS